MKSPRYTAGVVSIYRKYVDYYLEHGRDGYKVDPADRRMLLDLFDRGGFTDGYYLHHNGREMVALKKNRPSGKEIRFCLTVWTGNMWKRKAGAVIRPCSGKGRRAAEAFPLVL